MKDVREAVTFRNRRGHRLFGIRHIPDSPGSQRTAVILLSPGVKMRVAPQRLYLRMTDRFLSMGFQVLRFDFYGLGDSEGEVGEALLRDLYNHVELGRYVDDTIDAMDWMQQQFGIERFLLGGLCGGAVTGLHVGGRDPRVVGLLGVGITPVVSARAGDASRYITVGQLTQTRKKYIRRLLSPQAWLRLLTLRADYRLIWRFLTQPLQRRPVPQPGSPVQAVAEDDNANPLFPGAFFSMLTARRPIFLAFGSTDRLQWEFDEKFVARHRETLASLPPLYDVHIVKNGNHVLSLTEWQQEMLDAAVRWLETRFPESSAASGEGPDVNRRA